MIGTVPLEPVLGRIRCRSPSVRMEHVTGIEVPASRPHRSPGGQQGYLHRAPRRAAGSQVFHGDELVSRRGNRSEQGRLACRTTRGKKGKRSQKRGRYDGKGEPGRHEGSGFRRSGDGGSEVKG